MFYSRFQWMPRLGRTICRKNIGVNDSKTAHETEDKITFRLIPRSFFSPSSRLSNLPMLAVLVRVMAKVFSISSFRCWRGLAARAIFC